MQHRRAALPDGHPGSSHVSLRVPNDVIEAFDQLAAILERPRSWVMVRALRQYLADEGAEIFEDEESLAELDRGETVSSEEVLRRVREMIERAETARAQKE
jgi:predicted transcriptional regulator